jgi:hypothetical protein
LPLQSYFTCMLNVVLICGHEQASSSFLIHATITEFFNLFVDNHCG